MINIEIKQKGEMHICKKNKLIHEDIKAVCNSATKKLIACGLAVAVNGGNIVNAQTREFDAQKQLKKELQVEESTAVGSVSNTANSQSRSSRQPRATAGSSENGTSQTTKKTEWRELSPEKLKEVIAKGKGEYETWLEWCKANRVRPVQEFLVLDAGEKVGEAALDFSFSENGGRFIVTHQAQNQPANNSPIVASEPTTEVNAANNPGERVTSNYSAEDFDKDAEKLLALMAARVTKLEQAFEKVNAEHEELQLETNKKVAAEFARYEHKPEDGEWKFTHANYLNIDDASATRFRDLPEEIKAAARKAYTLRYRLDYLRERIRDYNTRLDAQRWFSGFRAKTERCKLAENSLTPQTPEPNRYDIEQAQAYVAWAANEVNRLESLARVILQQLNVTSKEQVDFDDRMRWLDPQTGYGMLEFMSQEDSLEEFFRFAREVDLRGEQISRTGEELAALQSELRDIMQQGIALYQQPIQQREEQNRPMIQRIHPPVVPTRDDEDQQEVYEVQEVQEIQEDNNQNDANQQPQIRRILPGNPQQGDGVLGRIGSTVSSVFSLINPFRSNK